MARRVGMPQEATGKLGWGLGVLSYTGSHMGPKARVQALLH